MNTCSSCWESLSTNQSADPRRRVKIHLEMTSLSLLPPQVNEDWRGGLVYSDFGLNVGSGFCWQEIKLTARINLSFNNPEVWILWGHMECSGKVTAARSIPDLIGIRSPHPILPHRLTPPPRPDDPVLSALTQYQTAALLLTRISSFQLLLFVWAATPTNRKQLLNVWLNSVILCRNACRPPPLTPELYVQAAVNKR